MDITDIKVFPVDEDRLKAYVTITFDECFVVRDLKVIQGPAGLFIAMPAKRRKDGTFKDLAHPLNAETRAWIERQVLDKYHHEVGANAGGPVGRPASDDETTSDEEKTIAEKVSVK
jgi:stage V sporulation protein G